MRTFVITFFILWLFTWQESVNPLIGKDSNQIVLIVLSCRSCNKWEKHRVDAMQNILNAIMGIALYIVHKNS